MAHGYIGDGYGIDGGREDRDERDRQWRGRDRDWLDREKGSHDRHRDWHDRDRGFMFDRDREDHRYGRERGYGGFEGDYRGNQTWDTDRGGFGESDEYRGGRRSFSAHPDDHYRSWRDRHMQSLDRDYADYCREREQAFHQDFDAWLTQRHGNPGPLRTGMTQTGFSHQPEGELELTDAAKEGQYEEDPVDTATLGTTSGGGKRR
jgi:hypothetical protein